MAQLWPMLVVSLTGYDDRSAVLGLRRRGGLTTTYRLGAPDADAVSKKTAPSREQLMSRFTLVRDSA